VGRLYPEKDPLQAVAAVESVRRRRPATLELYGDGILAARLEELARSRPWLAVHGTQSWDAIQEIQGRAHLCLSTSRREGAQLAVLEPMSRGVPVVCTRVGDAPRYYLDPALERFCVPPADTDTTAAAILELASSYERYRDAFSENAKLLRASHRDGIEAFASLIEAAARPRRVWSRWPLTPARLRGRGR
jgi:glycosyltransferase involved in cell wall biosynthesis